MKSTPVLGDLRAERDTKMLDNAFFESPDYIAILEGPDRPIVVGRRGTGKSALLYRLSKDWRTADNVVLQLAPEEDQAPGFRSIVEAFGENRRTQRAAARKLWEYALIMEVALALSQHYRFRKSEYAVRLRPIIADWEGLGGTFAIRLRRRAEALPLSTTPIPHLIGELSGLLGLEELRTMLSEVLEQSGTKCAVLVDRIDEGFDPDETGIEIVSGLVYSAFDAMAHVHGLRVVLFLRDNVFRGFARDDDDYSRNIEGNVIRLHWSESDLLTMVAKRLKSAFSLTLDRPLGIWDRCVSRELAGIEGFKYCLRSTLYRPRDLVSLLNESLRVAARHERTVLIPDDVNLAAREISRARLDDLRKEYATIVAGVGELTSAFSRQSARMVVNTAREIIRPVIESDRYPPAVQQAFAFYESVDEAIVALYSIGFIGIREPSTGVFSFCHDGREPSLDLSGDREVLIHPCYWQALDVTAISDDGGRVAEVFDEYEIEVKSQDVEQKKKTIGRHIGALATIGSSADGAGEFEQWCFKTIRWVFAGGLRNVEMKPNKNAVSRRDVVGRNDGSTHFWRRVLEDYEARQVVFEVKNYDEPLQDDYRQALSYLGDPYGRIAFIVYRSDRINLTASLGLSWMREYYKSSQHRALIVRVSSKFLCDQLSKLRSAEKADAPDEAMAKLLDQYQRNYLGEKVSRRRRR
jgi:hypothetical protein